MDFSFFKAENKISKELSDIFLDKSIVSRYKTIAAYLNSEGVSYSKKEYSKFIKFLEDNIYKQLKFAAHLLYHIYEVSGKWGEFGEQQVKIAFCRGLLDIAPEDEVSSEHATQFLSLVQDNLDALGISSLSYDEAKTKYHKIFVECLGKIYYPKDIYRINKRLRFCGSECLVTSGAVGGWVGFIMGVGVTEFRAEYEISTIEKELISTPNYIMSIAACTGKRDIFIRQVSLRTIFSQKWLALFSEDSGSQDKLMSDIYCNISRGIKDKVLTLYGVGSRAELLKIGKSFVDDLSETIWWHEIGHGVTSDYVLSPEAVGISLGSKHFGENILSSLDEILADFAPSRSKLRGPMKNLVLISKSDYKRAERMFYMYFSDVWFFDTDDDYMYIYSDLMALILLRYVKDDLSIDFQKLDTDLTFKETGDSEGKTSLFENVFDLYVWITEGFVKIAKNAKYELSGEKKSYGYIKSLRKKMDRKEIGVDFNGIDYFTTYWARIFNYMDQISDSKEKIHKFIESQEAKAMELLINSTI